MLNTLRKKLGGSLRRVGLIGTVRTAMKRGRRHLELALSPAKRAARRNQEARAAQLKAEFFAREAEFDRIHNVDTTGIVSLDSLDEVVGPHRHVGSPYEGADFDLLRDWIAGLGIDFPQYTFLDLGSGKGRALLIAAQFPFRQVRGIEFAPALHAVAVKNLASYRGPRVCTDVRADLGDAAEYPVPAGPLVVFIYNPFAGAVMDRVLANLARSHREQPRDIRVAYWTPMEEALFIRHGFARDPDPPAGPAIINHYGSRSSIWRL
jgi:hypothetical protein